MSISENIAVEPTALWPQGDIRDPLGVWGFRLGVTGDATGGAIKVGATESAGQKGAFLYTCYSATCAHLTGASVAVAVKLRLLTLWPNIDPVPGVQAYGSLIINRMDGSVNLTPPKDGPAISLVAPQDRFLLLFDPRQFGALGTIVELEYGDNVLNDTFSFEGYGYYWDRSVLNAPGGPRHPGAS